MKVSQVPTPKNPLAGRPLLDLAKVGSGRKVTVITGSTKTKNLQYRQGTVREVLATPVGLTGKFQLLTAVVQLDGSPELVTSHRLQSAAK